MYELTHSPFDLGLIGLVQFVPAIGLFALTGHAADHYDRRLVTCIGEFIEAAAVAVLAVANAGGRLTPLLLLAMAFVVGTGRAFEQPSLQSVLIGGFSTIAIVLISTKIFRELFDADRYRDSPP